MQIQGKVVLVTGASEGIGAECARLCAERGAKVALVARTEARLRSVARPDDLVLAADLADPAQRATLIERVTAAFGRIDILINNAGVGLYQPSYEAEMDAARRMFEVNLFAAVDLAQRAVPVMREQRSGFIVNVSSIAGVTTLPWLTLYSASKSAVCSFSEGLRTEVEPFGIQVMAVCPGYVRTRFQANILGGKPPDLGGRTREWAITPQRCAADIVDGIERNRRFLITPASGWVLVLLQRFWPRLLQSQFGRIYRRDHAETRT